MNLPSLVFKLVGSGRRGRSLGSPRSRHRVPATLLSAHPYTGQDWLQRSIPLRHFSLRSLTQGVQNLYHQDPATPALPGSEPNPSAAHASLLLRRRCRARAERIWWRTNRRRADVGRSERGGRRVNAHGLSPERWAKGATAEGWAAPATDSRNMGQTRARADRAPWGLTE